MWTYGLGVKETDNTCLQNNSGGVSFTSIAVGQAYVEESWYREGVREGTRRYQLRLETAPVLLCRLLTIGVEL